MSKMVTPAVSEYDDLLVQRKLSPEIKTSTVIAWRRHIPHSRAVNKFINEVNAFEA